VIELCSRAVNAEDDEEVRQLAQELRQILHERIEQLRSRLAFTSIPERSRLIDPRRS
jgi:hypothetical protein